ncbi:Os03g0268200, partial [Oryza sativa Japonica Group]
IKDAKHLEGFSIQLVVLATWKQAIYICTSYASSATRENPSHDVTAKGFGSNAPHLLANSQLLYDTCMEIESQFLVQMEYAEELANTIGQTVDATEMPDAIEIIFQTALNLGRHGGVDEMMGKSASAMVLYSKAVSMLRFLLTEAPSLALNPALSLTRDDRRRLRTYIEAVNARLVPLQYQRH